MWQLKESQNLPALAWKVLHAGSQHSQHSLSTLRQGQLYTNQKFFISPHPQPIKTRDQRGESLRLLCSDIFIYLLQFSPQKVQKAQGNPTGMAEVRAFTASQAIFGLKPGTLLMDLDGCP